MLHKKPPKLCGETNELWSGFQAGLWKPIFLHVVQPMVTQVIYFDSGPVWRYEIFIHMPSALAGLSDWLAQVEPFFQDFPSSPSNKCATFMTTQGSKYKSSKIQDTGPGRYCKGQNCRNWYNIISMVPYWYVYPIFNGRGNKTQLLKRRVSKNIQPSLLQK